MNNLVKIKEKFSTYVKSLQDKITNELKRLDRDLIVQEDLWTRLDAKGNAGGGGRTRYHHGKIFESAGVNTSEIYGVIDGNFAKTLAGQGSELWASGISLIIHPLSPKIPTVHANFRMIHQGDRVWFGGGADLTPYYPLDEDFHYFHQVWQKACSPYGSYAQMKKDCDNYFVNHHRQSEMRGIGGIFFDHFSKDGLEADSAMVMDLADHFISSYVPIVEKRLSEVWTKEDEDFQLHRRGRYVEFNLLHDRGTLFGLKSNGRTESILISLPPRCKFTYDYHPEKGSAHEKMMENYFPKPWGQ